MILVENLPKEIKELANQKALKRPCLECECGFNWSETIEGYEFWFEIFECENYELFYKTYPIS